MAEMKGVPSVKPTRGRSDDREMSQQADDVHEVLPQEARATIVSQREGEGSMRGPTPHVPQRVQLLEVRPRRALPQKSRLPCLCVAPERWAMAAQRPGGLGRGTTSVQGHGRDQTAVGDP